DRRAAVRDAAGAGGPLRVRARDRAARLALLDRRRARGRRRRARRARVGWGAVRAPVGRSARARGASDLGVVLGGRRAAATALLAAAGVLDRFRVRVGDAG